MEKTKRHKLLKAAGIIAVAISVLAIGAGIYIQSEARRIIAREFAKLTHGRYQLSVGEVKVNPFRRSVTLIDLSVTPNSDTTILKNRGFARNAYLFDLSAQRLLMTGIRLRDGLEIKKVRLQAPEIKVRKSQAGEIPPDSGRKATPFRIAIGQVVINEGYAELNENDTARSVIEGLELRTESVLVEPGSAASAWPLGEHLTLAAARLWSLNDDGSMRVEVDSVGVEMAARTIRIGSFALIPTYSKEEFGWKSSKHKDWQQAHVSGISFHGVDFRHWIAHRELLIDSLYLTEGSFASFKNRNILRKEWIKPLYHQVIQRLPVRFTVRKSVIGSFDARYEELKLGGDTPGVITFNRIGGQVEWLSNIPAPDRTYSEWRLRAELMDSAPLAVTVLMPVDSLTNRFEVSANLGKMEMKLLNRMVRPLADVALKDGTIHQLDCRITGNARASSVEMTFLYSGLELAILKERKGHVKENQLITEILNVLVLKESNPRHDRIRHAHQTVERDPYRSPWNYLWRTVFAGVKETIGLNH